jgi:hypothetical protein
MGTKWFSWILGGGNGILKEIYLLHNDNIGSRGLQRISKKFGNIVTIYHRELLKKIPSLGIFYTQSVIQGLRSTVLQELVKSVVSYIVTKRFVL